MMITQQRNGRDAKGRTWHVERQYGHPETAHEAVRRAVAALMAGQKVARAGGSWTAQSRQEGDSDESNSP